MQNVYKKHDRGKRARLGVGARAICVKSLAAIAVCVSLILSSFITAFADAIQPDSRTVKAGIFSFEGYHMKDDDGALTGYGVEFLNLVSEYSRLNFQYTGYDRSWGEMLDMLENGEIDVVTSARRTPDREERFAFSLPIGRNNTVLSIRVDNTQLHRGDYGSYNGMTVGQLTGSSQNESLADFAEEKGFSYRTKDYDDSDALTTALQNGEVDAILSSDLRKAENEKTLDIIEVADFYAIVRKDDTDLINEINYAIEQMDINEGDWKNELFYRYYGPVYSSALSFTEREQAYIRQVISGEKTITVTASGERAPYSYAENGELKGILPDYFASLMELAGLPYETVVPKDADDYYNLADTNGVNVVLDSLNSGDITEEADYRGFNTNGYMSVRMARVTAQDHKETGKIIAMCESQGKALIDPELLNGSRVVDYPTGEDALRAVMDKKADVAYVYAYTAQMFVNHDPTNSLHYNILSGVSARLSMYVSENTDHELITILNKCIKLTPDDALNQLGIKYTTYTIGDMTVWQYMKANPAIMIAVVFALALIVCVILALYLRGRWNRKLLHTTEKSNRKMSEQLAIVEALSRDYTNVYAVNAEHATARVIKLEGYVTEGLKKGAAEEYDYAPILEQYIRSRVHPDDQQELADALSLDNVKEQLAENEEYFGSYRIVDGEDIHHFQYTYLKIENNDQKHESFILAGFRNIDEVIRKEQQQKEVLSEALAQAQYANNAKTTFLNNMSHDIRTPMNAIIGFTSLAADHIDNKEQMRDYLGKIMTSGNHLLSLINDVLDMSRIESGKVKIEEKETSLPEIMHDLKTIVQSDVKARELDFHIDTLDVTNETIVCDKLRLNQVLLNVLSNAIKYTRPGGAVGVRVLQTSQPEEGRAEYEFRVKDTGIGMSREFLKHVFEPFEREQTSTVSGIQGTGLGLAITKNIVDMMNGTITVESEEGKGSEFIVTFRFRVVEAPENERRQEALASLKVLVADGSEEACGGICKMLSAFGAFTDSASSGSAAADLAKLALERNEPYNAYIIGDPMPDMSGAELVRRIREAAGEQPVILLTANDHSDIEKEAIEAGVTAFCDKPLFPSGLKAALTSPQENHESDSATDSSEPHFDGKRLLLVEDNELNQEIAQTILEGMGFSVDTADDGSAAVKRMEDMPANTYDLILMDVQMPIMDGYSATRAIRALEDPAKAKIPIVAMTANAFEEDKKEAINSGMNGYVAKPINIEQLVETLLKNLK